MTRSIRITRLRTSRTSHFIARLRSRNARTEVPIADGPAKDECRVPVALMNVHSLKLHAEEIAPISRGAVLDRLHLARGVSFF